MSGEADRRPAGNAAGAMKTSGLYSVGQGFPKLKDTESPGEHILKYRFQGHTCRNRDSIGLRWDSEACILPSMDAGGPHLGVSLYKSWGTTEEQGRGCQGRGRFCVWGFRAGGLWTTPGEEGVGTDHHGSRGSGPAPTLMDAQDRSWQDTEAASQVDFLCHWSSKTRKVTWVWERLGQELPAQRPHLREGGCPEGARPHLCVVPLIKPEAPRLGRGCHPGLEQSWNTNKGKRACPRVQAAWMPRPAQ